MRQPGEPLRIVLLGRLGARKGVPELLQALASPTLLDEAWSATLAGDGEVDVFRHEAKSLGIGDRVHLPGWVDSASALALLQRAHVLVLPSYAEGLPMSILEAFAHAVPVVTTSVGAVGDAVQDGVQGVVIAPGDVNGLAAAIRALLGDEDWRSTLGRNARRTWEERYAVGPYADDLLNLWSSVAK